MLLKQLPEDFLVREIPSFQLEPGGAYTYFFLSKRNMTTEYAIQFLSRKYHIKRKHFGYAGNKDRRAVTRQYCSVRGRIYDKTWDGLEVKVVGTGTKPISLGDLKKNQFRIIVRKIRKRPLAADFIINYFDDQRFGRNNLAIGLALLKRDFKKASSLAARHEVTEHLAASPHDFAGAVNKIPLKIRMLYLHAVQSFFWNRLVSEGLEKSPGKSISISYSQGTLCFPLVRPCNKKIPYIDFSLEDEMFEPGYANLLKEYGLTPRDFLCKEMPYATPSGGERDMVVEVQDLAIGGLEHDELHAGKMKVMLEFFLQPGSYATMAVKRMFSA